MPIYQGAVFKSAEVGLVSVDCDLAEILWRANRMLRESTPDNCFVTLVLAQLDPANRCLRYVNCGHSTGYLLDRGGSVKHRLDSTTPPLGCLEEYTVGSVPQYALEAGDVLVMLTDGILEAQSPEEHFFGDHRALDVVRANLHAPAAEIVEALYRAAREFCQAHSTQDDVTSLVVKVGPA